MAYDGTAAWRAFCERASEGEPSAELFERVVGALVDPPAVGVGSLGDAAVDAAVATRIRGFDEEGFQALLFGLAKHP
ncbi:hypothetical protein HY480_01270 [Candidatus Uhrbacteria bacterium]|nr:hypothetical protein [Candidatus Uhrbacteria bacterium]